MGTTCMYVDLATRYIKLIHYRRWSYIKCHGDNGYWAPKYSDKRLVLCVCCHLTPKFATCGCANGRVIQATTVTFCFSSCTCSRSTGGMEGFVVLGTTGTSSVPFKSVRPIWITRFTKAVHNLRSCQNRSLYSCVPWIRSYMIVRGCWGESYNILSKRMVEAYPRL